jgi:hypothetical protein
MMLVFCALSCACIVIGGNAGKWPMLAFLLLGTFGMWFFMLFWDGRQPRGDPEHPERLYGPNDGYADEDEGK